MLIQNVNQDAYFKSLYETHCKFLNLDADKPKEFSAQNLNTLFNLLIQDYGVQQGFKKPEQLKKMIDLFVEFNCPNAIYYKAQALMGVAQRLKDPNEDYPKDFVQAGQLMEKLKDVTEIDRYDSSQHKMSSHILTEKELGILKQEAKKTEINSDLAYSIYDRGSSFIDAAELIFKHAELEEAVKQEAIDYIQAIHEIWEENRPNALKLEDLAALERVLIDKVNDVVYEGKKNWKKIKDELDNAENHVNWKQREKISSLSGNVGETSIARTEVPISTFTNAQEEEWLKILDPAPPQWFNALALWEQNYFKTRLQEWQNQKDISEPNLGKFLGSVPTTIRRYPGSPNTYHTQATITGKEGTFTFDKIRSGVLAPVKMKTKSKAQKGHVVEITRQNMEQLLVEAINSKLAKVPEGNDQISFPILLQTLYSPPFQPPGGYTNEAMRKALKEMREILNNPKSLQNFITQNHINTKGHELKIDLLFSNRPVNKGRGLSEKASKLSNIAEENKNTVNILSRHLNEQLKNNPNDNDLKFASEAIRQYKNLNKKIGTFSAVKLLMKNPPYNAIAERAAYEQLVATKIGVRIGSCVSGKDREEMITEIALAQIQFYSKYAKFPPPYHRKNSIEDTKLRDEFEEMVAHQYLKGHGQKLAGENSRGCDGLKNVQDVFGTRICEKIKEHAKDYGIDSSFDPVKDVQKVAGLNKLNTIKLGKVTKSDIFKNFVIGIITKYSHIKNVNNKKKEMKSEIKKRKSLLLSNQSHTAGSFSGIQQAAKAGSPEMNQQTMESQSAKNKKKR